jgi:hypothetical protein
MGVMQNIFEKLAKFEMALALSSWTPLSIAIKLMRALRPNAGGVVSGTGHDFGSIGTKGDRGDAPLVSDELR